MKHLFDDTVSEGPISQTAKRYKYYMRKIYDKYKLSGKLFLGDYLFDRKSFPFLFLLNKKIVIRYQTEIKSVQFEKLVTFPNEIDYDVRNL